MNESIVRHKKILASLFLAFLLCCLGHLLRIYAHSNEAVALSMAPFVEAERLTAVGILVAALGLLCWIAAPLLVLCCLTQRLWARRILLEW